MIVSYVIGLEPVSLLSFNRDYGMLYEFLDCLGVWRVKLLEDKSSQFLSVAWTPTWKWGGALEAVIT